MYPPLPPSMSVKYAASGFNSSIMDWIVEPSVPAFASAFPLSTGIRHVIMKRISTIPSQRVIPLELALNGGRYRSGLRGDSGTDMARPLLPGELQPRVVAEETAPDLRVEVLGYLMLGGFVCGLASLS